MSLFLSLKIPSTFLWVLNQLPRYCPQRRREMMYPLKNRKKGDECTMLSLGGSYLSLSRLTVDEQVKAGTSIWQTWRVWPIPKITSSSSSSSS
jgi:hypothetical protein